MKIKKIWMTPLLYLNVIKLINDFSVNKKIIPSSHSFNYESHKQIIYVFNKSP